MTYSKLLFATAAAAAVLLAGGVARAEDAPGKGVTIYMQMGGNPGDGATLARQTGAAAAAQALGVDKLNAQFSAWAPEKMIEQFKQALAAKPSCIVIMGHPGSDAFHARMGFTEIGRATTADGAKTVRYLQRLLQGSG